MQATMERPATITATTPAKPLTDAEADALLIAGASMERTPRVTGPHRSHGESRAWTAQGNVD